MSLLAASSVALAQSDDFGSGNDSVWTHYDPFLQLFGPHAVYIVTNGQYHITAELSPSPEQAGPARAGSLREDRVYSSFYVAVDFTGWDNELNQAFGVLALVQPAIGLQQTSGYAVTYQTKYQDIQVSLVVGEVPTEIVPLQPGQPDCELSPTNVYRMVFKGQNGFLDAAVYLASDLRTPLAYLNCFDQRFTSGTCGLVVYDNSGGTGTSDVYFDNYYADSEEPPRLDAQLNSIPEIILNWSTNFPGFKLQWTDTLKPPASWYDIGGGIDIVGDRYQFIEDASSGVKYYRLSK